MSFAQSSGDSQDIVTRALRDSDQIRGLGAFPRVPLILALDSFSCSGAQHRGHKT